MHKTDVNTAVYDTQADNVVNTTIDRDIRQLTYDVESSVTDGVILIDAIFDLLDRLNDVPPSLLKAVATVNCFALCAKRHFALIGEANDQIVGITMAVPR